MMVGDDLGKIQFSLMYDFPDQTLVLRIVKANHLPAKDFRYLSSIVQFYFTV